MIKRQYYHYELFFRLQRCQQSTDNMYGELDGAVKSTVAAVDHLLVTVYNLITMAILRLISSHLALFHYVSTRLLPCVFRICFLLGSLSECTAVRCSGCCVFFKSFLTVCSIFHFCICAESKLHENFECAFCKPCTFVDVYLFADNFIMLQFIYYFLRLFSEVRLNT